tara:strand:- start:7593 stop:8246 length:654 start_codon:yes stop_codon:yes gene_type:complete
MNTIARIELDSNFPKEFQTYVIQEITNRVRRSSAKIRESVLKDLKEAVRKRFFMSDEYGSIVAGRLRAELGVPQSETRIQQIITTWINGITVKAKVGTTPFLLIDIGILQSDYSDVLGLPAASYIYNSKRGGGEIPWLEWLLLEGDRRIVNKYEFSPEIKRGSRTGMGVMIQKARGFWQVPPDMSGTSVDNFATRALKNIDREIDQIVEKAIRGALK